jgi:hypothetical protein
VFKKVLFVISSAELAAKVIKSELQNARHKKRKNTIPSFFVLNLQESC